MCRQEKVDCTFGCEDTTSFGVTGECLPDEDIEAVTITHGYSKDHRPDLKQVVLEMMTSQDGGIPILMKCWDGNSDDNSIFQYRAKTRVAGKVEAKVIKALGAVPVSMSSAEVPMALQRGVVDAVLFNPWSAQGRVLVPLDSTGNPS